MSAAPAAQPDRAPATRLRAVLAAAGGAWLDARQLAAALPDVDRLRARANLLAREGWARRSQGPDGEAVWRAAHGRRA